MNKSRLTTIFGALLGIASATCAQAATDIWAGPGVGTNAWSTNAFWSLGASPGPNDDVRFFDGGAAGLAVSNVNNFVDASLGIGSLQYGNTNGNHTTLIAPGQTLLVTNANGLVVGTLTDNGNAQLVTATMVGSGGSLVVTNPTATIIINQGRSANGNGTQRATLDMTGLDTFVANVSRIGVGTAILGGANNAQNATGTLKLARTNIIASTFVVATITNSTSTPTNAIEVGGDNGNTGGADFLFLGQTNTFLVDSIGVGKLKTTASMLFNPAFSNPVAVFRTTNGVDRVRWWTIGDMWSSGSSSSGCSGTNDFSGGTVDALVDTMSLGRDRPGGNTGSTTNLGILTFTSGTINVNTLKVGNQDGTAAANTNPNAGFVNVNGSGATLVVNSNLVLGNTTVNSTAALKTSGTLNIVNGTVKASLITVGAISTNNTITMTNGTLIITNTVGAPGRGLTTFSLTNSTLRLSVANGGPIIVATNLITGGLTNQVNFTSVAVFPSYPTQLTLIQYAGTIGGVGYNFGFGVGPVPASAPGAYISNNVANKSVDLVLPFDPRPVVNSQPSSYSGSPGDNVTFAVGISGGSVTPLSYQWYLNATNALTDGLTPNGSTLTGSTTASLGITNAQPGDNGNYTVIITNLFGSATSSPPATLTIAASDIPPSITGPTNQTVIAGNNTTISAVTAGSPLPTLQWQFNSANLADGPTGNGDTISGSTGNALTINNAQYPSSQGTYSLIASNRAGVVTNSMLLTVIVTPSISNQPVSLVVTAGQSASFSVAAGGVPDPVYQWKTNGIAILNATNATYTIGSAAPSDMATYSVVVANAAGSVTSSNVTLTVNSATMAVTSLTPNSGASGVCYDTPLYISFNQLPVLNTLGKIRVYNSTNAVTPVDTLDLSLGSPQNRTVGGVSLNSYPVIISGNTAAIYPHLDLLTSNQTYYVTIDDGAFKDSTGAYFAGITNPATWSFTTKVAGPAAGSTNLVVAPDGSGDFVTVQGALDSLAANNPNRVLISIRNGVYTEIVRVNTKTNVTLRGQDRHGTVIAYPNNNNINASTTTRPMFGLESSSDIAIENLTLTNSTPHGGSQAEALLVDHTKRFILYNADLDSFQDTLLVNQSGDQAYVQDSHIQGDTDYIWGSGTLYVTNTELMAMTAGSHLTQPRTAQSSNGLAFVNCRIFAAGSGVTNSDLGRDAGSSGGAASFGFGQVAYINCAIDTNLIIPAGWILGSGTVQGVETANLRFWEYQSVDLAGNPVSTSSRVPWSLELDGTTATNQVQNPTVWLYGWQPQLAPNITNQPSSQSVSGGATATFTVGATGISAPSYQWLKHGTNLPGATGATLTINSAHAGDADTYAVVVSNGAGSVTSSTVTLSVGNTAPTLGPVGNSTINAGVVLSITNTATDPDVPPQTLTFSLLSAPTNATLDASSGIFGWRPLVSQANSTNTITIQVADNGTPSLSVTQSFVVTVNPLGRPSVSAGNYSSGQFVLSVSGDIGPDYIVQASTNLINWSSLFTTNSPVTPFQFTDTNAAAYPIQYYRILLGP